MTAIAGRKKDAGADPKAAGGSRAESVSRFFVIECLKLRMIKEQRAAMMQQVLENDARVRLANIAAVKPEKAEQLENIIIGNMQRGIVQGKISES